MWGDCQLWRNEIEEGADGAALSGGARAHLSDCPACRCARAEGEKLRLLLGGLERVDAPPDFDFRLRARMARRGGRGGTAKALPRFALGLGAAACLLIVAALALLSAPSRDAATGAGTDAAARGAAGDSEPAVGTLQPGGGDAAPEVAATATAPAPNLVPNSASNLAPAAAPGRRAGRVAAARSLKARASGGRAGLSREVREAVYGSSVAEVRAGAGVSEEAAAVQGSPLAIPVGGSDEPLRVLLRDERGGARLVPTRSVSFGAQQIVARDKGAQKASLRNQEGVW